MATTIGGFNVPQQLTSCKAASTANISGTYYNGPSLNGILSTLTTTASTLTVDGIAINLFDRVLLHNQTDASQNGIYYYSGVSVAGNVILSRTDDFDLGAKMRIGSFLPVEQGTVNGGAIFTFITPEPIIVGTTNLTFNDVGAVGGGTITSITANNGILATPNPITTTGTIGLAPIASDTILGNLTGGNANPAAVTMTQALDATIGSTQGDIIYRDASTWAALAPGTAGMPLLTSGASANPVWTPIYIYQKTPVNTGTVLTAAAFGTEVVCTGSSAYAVTLPAVASNAEKFIDFSVRTTSHALVTITPASGTIMGQATFILGSNEGCRVVTDGTNWFVTNYMMQPVSCYAYLASNQTGVTSAGTITILLDTTIFNVGGFYDTTNHKFQPLYPGKYSFCVYVRWLSDGFSAGDTYNVNFQTGTTVPTSQCIQAVQGSTTQLSATLSGIGNFNGSTDLLIPAATITSAATNILYVGNSSNTFLAASRLSNF